MGGRRRGKEEKEEEKEEESRKIKNLVIAGVILHL